MFLDPLGILQAENQKASQPPWYTASRDPLAGLPGIAEALLSPRLRDPEPKTQRRSHPKLEVRYTSPVPKWMIQITVG